MEVHDHPGRVPPSRRGLLVPRHQRQSGQARPLRVGDLQLSGTVHRVTQTERRERSAAPEHRWPAVIATVVALAAYAFLPSVVPAIERYAVVGVCLLMIVALVLYNPHRLTRESRWSRRAEIALAIFILVANQIAFAETIIRLLNKRGN